MNQLKSEELLLRHVHRSAESFQEKEKRSTEIVNDLEESLKSAAGKQASIDKDAAAIQQLVGDSHQSVAKINELASNAQQNDEKISKALAVSEQSAAEIQEISAKCTAIHEQVKERVDLLDALKKQFASSLEDHSVKSKEIIEELQRNHESIIESTKEDLSIFLTSQANTLEVLRDKCKEDLESNNANQIKEISDLREEVKSLSEDTSDKLENLSKSSAKTITDAVATFKSESGSALKDSTRDFEDRISECEKKAQAVVDKNNEELKTLTSALEELESRIRVSIERATGYTLFHSFQTRQIGVEKAKKFWTYALGVSLLATILGAVFLIIELRNVQTYNVAFFLRLGLSIPLIYAVAFCSVQYSRERRLEEEYAFKSNISISLEPYQKLVEQLIDKEKPEELAKYTQFIIDSVNRVFTSPTPQIFDDHTKEKDSAEGLIKVLTDFAKTLFQHK